ncbi:protein CDV3 homolog [Stomoxys calcitrans]|uniref:Protein CDV3 homolog n=1 Tax=Stomoxys calcitrans TaxID=35570 RepID=A0A1I8NX37_STOCA|nr:protein CDV3 homolog [Stomoxys calcitrans]
MADLDDFFAKKDKKKSKKPKFLTAEELVKNLEESSKREVLKPKKPETTTTTAPAATEIGNVEEKIVEQPQEDEWKEIEEEQRKDYSGLKIGQLTLNDDDDLSASEGQDEDGDSDGNGNGDSVRIGAGGVWKKVIPAEEVTQIPMDMPPKPVSKVYVSPALRAAAAQGSGPKPKVRSKTAPDITNADFFPTLGAARPEEQRKKKNEPAFEEVRHGGRVQRVKETTAAPTAATNRFQSLDEAES